RIDDLPVAKNLTPEQEELIQGAGLKSFRPTLEHLEARELLSGNPVTLPGLPSAPAPVQQALNQMQINYNIEGRGQASGLAPMTQPVQFVQGTVLQSQLQAAFAGPGGRADLQQVGKLILDAAQREAKALWGNKVEAGILQVALGQVTQSDHGVLVKFRLNDVIGGTVRAYRGFEVQIKSDAKGAVTAEFNFREAWGRSSFLPNGQDAAFVQNMNKAGGGPLWVAPTLAEGFL